MDLGSRVEKRTEMLPKVTEHGVQRASNYLGYLWKDESDQWRILLTTELHQESGQGWTLLPLCKGGSGLCNS